MNVASQLLLPTDGGGFEPPSRTSYTSIAALNDGGFVVTYAHFREGISARIFDNNGIAKGDEFRVATYSNLMHYPEIATLSDGSFVIGWAESKLGDSQYNSDVFLRHYDGNGIAVNGGVKGYQIAREECTS